MSSSTSTHLHYKLVWVVLIGLSAANASFITNNLLISPSQEAIRCATSLEGKGSNHHLRMNSKLSSMCHDIIFWPSTDGDSSTSPYFTEPIDQTKSEIISYLHKNLMPFDIINANSLGFPHNFTADDNNILPDGLSNGLLEPTINISMHAKQNYPWTNNVPKDMFFEYVTSFANVNEARTNWRPIIHELVESIIHPLLEKYDTSPNNSTISVKEVINLLNDKIWAVAASYSKSESIKFQHGQTPLIYDPMSVLLFGYASCTGLSIFFVNVLRTAGIPARLAGTAAWNGKEENGNHSWIEVWDSDDGEWHILETKPASGNHENIDLYDPCQWWFCNEDKVKDTEFWAARLDRDMCDGITFPMAWDMDNDAVVGEDRTLFMTDLCSMC